MARQTPPPKNGTPPKDPNTPATPALTFSSSTASPSILATPRHLNEPNTPSPPSRFNQFGGGGGTLKSSLKPRAASVSERSATGDSNDDAEDKELEIPPWDRTVELVWTRRIATLDNKLWDDELSFQENSVRLAASSAVLRPTVIDKTDTAKGKGVSTMASNENSELPKQRKDVSGKDNCRYFQLPNRVRFKITKLVVKSHNSGKPVRLNSPVFLDPIWPVNRISKSDPQFWSTDYFDSLETVLEGLDPYTTVCFAMRVDFLTTMFLTRRFHVVYSPFVGERLQPAATLYMDRFGPLMKWINLEIDLSKLGGNWHPDAANMDMSKTVVRIKERIEQFAESQLTRGAGTTLQSLIIMVRRYYGFRPGTANTVKENPSSFHGGGKPDIPKEIKTETGKGKGVIQGLARGPSLGEPNSDKENVDPEKDYSDGVRTGSDDLRSSPLAEEKGEGKDIDPPQDDNKVGQEEDNESKKDKGKDTAGGVDKTSSSTEIDADRDREEKSEGVEKETSGLSSSEPQDKSGESQGNDDSPKEDKGKMPAGDVANNPSPTDQNVTTKTGGKAKVKNDDPVKGLARSIIAPSQPLAQGIPYCSDEYLTILDPIKKLGPLIDNLCMVGTSRTYANDFIEAIWGKDRPKSRRESGILCHFRAPPRAYPYTPGQHSAVDNGPRGGRLQIVQHETDPRKWVGLYGCLATDHWEKYGPGPFIFKTSKIPTRPATPMFPPPPNSPVVDPAGPRRRSSVASHTHRRRISASSLLNLITRTSTSTTRPGSIFGIGSGGNSSSGSIPPVRESPSPTPSFPTLPGEKKKSRRMSFFFQSKIPVLSKKHMLSPPGLRARLGLKKDKSARPLPIPISLPYETGTLVSGSRESVGGHRFGFTRLVDRAARGVERVRVATRGSSVGPGVSERGNRGSRAGATSTAARGRASGIVRGGTGESARGRGASSRGSGAVRATSRGRGRRRGTETKTGAGTGRVIGLAWNSIN